MKERGWIVAARRRDGSAPSYVKGVTDCYESKAVYVYPSQEDAEEAAREWNESLHKSVYHVFEVEVSVLNPKKVKA